MSSNAVIIRKKAAKPSTLFKDLDERVTEHAGHATDLAMEECHCRKIIVSGGGDGTVNEVVNGIFLAKANNDVALLIDPIGTGNDAAYGLGIKTEEDAYRALIEGNLHRIDVGRVSFLNSAGKSVERYYIGNAGIGFTGKLCEAVRHFKFIGKHAYDVTIVYLLINYDCTPIKLEINDMPAVKRPSFFLDVYNNIFGGGGIRPAPKARMDDGLLDVIFAGKVGRIEAIMMLGQFKKGTHLGHHAIEHYLVSNVKATGDNLTVYADGEVLGRTAKNAPVTFAVVPSSLNVFYLKGKSEAINS
ncbi:MAG: diacylglycerol kinase family protein [Candidatus Woesearchaeota archaeon]